MGYYPPYHGPPRPPYYPPPKKHKKRRHPKPYWWKKWKLACTQILIPLAVFQLLRTLILPTSFDVLLLIILVGLTVYCCFTC
ncbi:hypothetical protein SAMN05192534_13817 [Alteribacillus persepolensis]|uniref:Uncharacterized protein n=1 Tax=Alteribacillus persepolensis TaxID=568899 RepID=A0A1G8JX48_9BACI|nr:hypothetical protein [Alteribacillus persepolensis]SDI35764.1 hypothetical protein SAMN05192534_13817 [Alteribacillus persepolensis]